MQGCYSLRRECMFFNKSNQLCNCFPCLIRIANCLNEAKALYYFFITFYCIWQSFWDCVIHSYIYEHNIWIIFIYERIKKMWGYYYCNMQPKYLTLPSILHRKTIENCVIIQYECIKYYTLRILPNELYLKQK